MHNRNHKVCAVTVYYSLGKITEHIAWACVFRRRQVNSYETKLEGGAHVPPTKLFRRLEVNKTIVKQRVAATTGTQYLYVGFSRRNKIPRCSAYDIGESNPIPASGL